LSGQRLIAIVTTLVFPNMTTRVLATLLFTAVAAFAQAGAASKAAKDADSKEIKLGEDEAGCKDSALLPRIAGCSIIQCDTNESDNVEFQIGMTPDGAVQKDVMEGSAEVLYYLCPAKVNLASIVKQSEAGLIKAGYKPIYSGKDADDQPLVTVAKETQWVQISTYMYNEYSAYVQTAIQVTPESPANSEALADEITRSGRVVLETLKFDQGASELPPDAEKVLSEVAAMLVRQAGWKVRVEVHSSDSADRHANVAASQKRATAVATWLVEHGIEQSRVTVQGHAEAKPDAASSGHRVEIVKL
jgi:outer membrane protein OmpA-like peptidoglycan-associated protein